MNEYKVKPYLPDGEILEVRVPASKSILNRALLLSAFSKGIVHLTCGALSEDTRAFLDCLYALGIVAKQTDHGITVHGCGGDVPVPNAVLNVKSAGTAARFLTIALAFAGGDYTLTSSEQMKRRPMDVLALLEEAGVTITYLEEKGHFPFRLHSDGIAAEDLTVDTDRSTQYASGILLAAGMRNVPLRLRLTGSRTDGSYINITKTMLRAFHTPYAEHESALTVFPSEQPPQQYTVEPDVSGACYFYALALLHRTRVLVHGVHSDSTQGDMKFLSLLAEKGVVFTEQAEGLLADGSNVKNFTGFDVDMSDFSDQTLTAAALAPFATSPSVLRNVSHIRLQECDRIAAIVENLAAIGVPASTDGNDIYITPAPVTGGAIDPHGDHRVAMAFSLIGLKTGNVTVSDPDCCKKTFENFFELLKEITR